MQIELVVEQHMTLLYFNCAIALQWNLSIYTVDTPGTAENVLNDEV